MSEKKKMSILAAIDNFWYYHKWKVAAVIVVLTGVISMVGYTRANTDNRDYDFTAISVFARPMTTGDYTIKEQINDSIKDIDNNGDVAIKITNYYITEAGTGDNDQISLSQFENEMSTANGDIILFDKANLDRFISKDFFADLSTYLDLSQIAEEDIVYRKDVPVAVRLTDSKALTDMDFIIDDIYVSVVFTPDNADQLTLASRNCAKAAIEKLLEK